MFHYRKPAYPIDMLMSTHNTADACSPVQLNCQMSNVVESTDAYIQYCSRQCLISKHMFDISYGPLIPAQAVLSSFVTTDTSDIATKLHRTRISSCH